MDKDGKDGKEAPAAAKNALNNIDGEDLAALDEDGSYSEQLNGKYRFENMIKTMIARIEYNNTLAPVQEYGRHQSRALKKKKPGKPKAGENENEDAETKGVKNKKDFDDRFYDLDDNFIDDGEMEDGYGAGLNGMGTETFMNDDFYQDREEDTNANVQSSMNMEYDPIADAKKEAENEEKRYK